MNEIRALDVAGPWGWLSSGVGYHLDNLGSWLIERAPVLGIAYASMLKPWPPTLVPRPGWKFAEEYYDKRQWLACRRGALWEVARRKGMIVPLTVPWHGATSVEVTLGNDNSLCLYVCGSFEPNEFAFLDRVLKPGMVFIDVGANDGYYTLFAAKRVGPSGKVIAVEPSSRERAHLRRNLARNALENVVVIPSALGAESGMAELKLAHGLHAGHNTLGGFAHDDVVTSTIERVKIETLDTVAKRLSLNSIDVMKIDVEGAEASVVNGAIACIEAWRPVMLMEINEKALRDQGHSANGLLDLLTTQLKYDVRIFTDAGAQLEKWKSGVPISANVAAIPVEKAAALGIAG